MTEDRMRVRLFRLDRPEERDGCREYLAGCLSKSLPTKIIWHQLLWNGGAWWSLGKTLQDCHRVDGVYCWTNLPPVPIEYGATNA